MDANAEAGQTSGSKEEWDKLLTAGNTEEPVGGTGQKYNNNGTPGVSTDPHPLPSSSPFTSHSNVMGDHINTAPHATPIKLPDLEQMKLAEETPPEEKKTNIKRKILKVVVTCMFITMAVGVIVIWTFHDGGSRNDGELSFFVDSKDLMVIVKRYQHQTTRGFLGGMLFANRVSEPDDCENTKNKYRNKCYTWEDNILRMTYFQTKNVNCYNVSWEIATTLLPMDCYELDKGYWYGMPQTWPAYAELPVTAFEYGRRQKKSAGTEFSEYFWMSSDGFGIYLIDHGPYLISWNESNSKRLCFAPEVTGSSDSKNKRHLSYTICQGYDAKQTHDAISHEYFKYSQQNASYMQTGWWNDLLWSVSYNESSDPDADLTNFAEFLKQHAFTCNIIEIRTHWEKEFGDLIFDQSKFTDMKSLTKKLANSQCRLQLQVSILCSVQSHCFQFGLNKGYFLLDSITNGVKLMQIQNAQVAIWDVSNDNFTFWYSDALSNISKDFDIIHFKLHNIPYISMAKTTTVGSVGLNSDYIMGWLDIIKTVTPISSLEGTFRSQEKTDFIEVDAKLDKSESGGKICVGHSLSGALVNSMSGYPYIMSTAYQTFDFENRQLYIRWLQLSSFFPALKIPSIFQTFGEEIINYTKNVSDFRNNYFLPCLQELKIDVSESTPIIRPVWWIDLDEEEDFPSLQLSDEFLIGNDILIAPVLCSDQLQRDVYFPLGTWYSPKHKKVYKGRQWIKNIKVSKYEMLYFVKNKYAENGGACSGADADFLL